MNQVEIFPDIVHLARAASRRILMAAEQSITRQGFFTLVLSGGSTPEPVYAMLAQARPTFDWGKVHIFWGDERCLPPDHPESNYRMARETLLLHAPIPETNIHRIRGEKPPRLAALDYEDELRRFSQQYGGVIKPEAGAMFPVFNMVLLGMGEDGHIASIFPGSPALEERQHWVVAIEHNRPPPPLVPRVTMTLPLINAAREIVLLVAGEKKAERVCELLSRKADNAVPAARLQPISGRFTWMLDAAAAVRISDLGL